MKKRLYRKRIIFLKTRPKTRLIKNEAIKHFLLQHLKPKKLNLEGVKESILFRLAQDDTIFENIFERKSDNKESGQNFPFNSKGGLILKFTENNK